MSNDAPAVTELTHRTIVPLAASLTWSTSFLGTDLCPALAHRNVLADEISLFISGTNDTLPFNCYSSEFLRLLGTPTLSGNASNAAIGQVWALAALYAGNCAAVQSETGELIGTAFVARDMIQVVDALKEDGMLRYWGKGHTNRLGKPQLI